VLDILLEEGEDLMSCMWSSKSFRNSDVEMCLDQPECAVISDTVAIANEGILKDHIGSLSGYGWAARFLQYYVRDRAILSLAEGIAKLTSIPAERLGLKTRGGLSGGYLRLRSGQYRLQRDRQEPAPLCVGHRACVGERPALDAQRRTHTSQCRPRGAGFRVVEWPERSYPENTCAP
jgi:hypothetical protein